MGEDDKEIWFLNRGLVLLRPKQPFVDWVRDSDPGTPVSDEVVWKEMEAFLIPQFDMTRDYYTWIRKNFDLMFEIALDSWYTEPSLWPEQRDWETFNRWFDVELVEMAWDLADEPLTSEAPQVRNGDSGGRGGSDNKF
ncbi:MAG TPA: hypothetical protein VFI91_03170 [Longimicrobiaceae bacterium]|nr:hypothetical protein [Longimicrobiaceae bacterium]